MKLETVMEFISLRLFWSLPGAGSRQNLEVL